MRRRVIELQRLMHKVSDKMNERRFKAGKNSAQSNSSNSGSQIPTDRKKVEFCFGSTGNSNNSNSSSNTNTSSKSNSMMTTTSDSKDKRTASASDSMQVDSVMSAVDSSTKHTAGELLSMDSSADNSSSTDHSRKTRKQRKGKSKKPLTEQDRLSDVRRHLL